MRNSFGVFRGFFFTEYQLFNQNKNKNYFKKKKKKKKKINKKIKKGETDEKKKIINFFEDIIIHKADSRGEADHGWLKR